nr:ATPase, T2SS/T4P/T4SS family [Shewanella sp. MMG014]
MKQPLLVSVVFIDECELSSVKLLLFVIDNYVGEGVDVRYYTCTIDLLNSFKFLNKQSLAVNQDALSSLEKKFYVLIEEAFCNGVSDLHIYRQDYDAKLYYRMQGRLIFIKNIPPFEIDLILGVFFNVLANEKKDVWNRRYLQDCSGSAYFANGTSVKVRYSHSPTESSNNEAYHAVMRVLATHSTSKSDEKNEQFIIPYIDKQLDEAIKKVSSKSTGLLVVAGSTGSGKSSSIQGILNWLYNEFHNKDVSIITVEDPVEYPIEGAAQTSVIRTVGKENDKGAFTKYLTSAMRRDPDILLIGETRDKQTAEVLAETVESGHFAITTLHAGSCISSISRLNTLGIDYKRMAAPGFLSGILCQKLIPVLCECSIPLFELKSSESLKPVLKALLKYSQVNKISTIRVVNQNGCTRCSGRGTLGRRALVELITFDDYKLEAIRSVDFRRLNECWVSDTDGVNGVTLFERGFQLMKDGFVCPFQLEKTFGIYHESLG